MAQFISEEYLKDNTPTNLNVDVKDIYSHVQSAQDLYVQDILGGKLYNELQAAVDASTYTAAQTKLLGYVQKMQVWWTLYLAFPWLNFKVKNKAIMKSHSENGDAADLTEMRWLRDDLKNRAEYYAQRLKDFLILNATDYPAYMNPELPVIPNRRSPMNNGMYFERGGGYLSDDCCPPIDPQDIGIYRID